MLNRPTDEALLTAFGLVLATFFGGPQPTKTGRLLVDPHLGALFPDGVTWDRAVISWTPKATLGMLNYVDIGHVGGLLLRYTYGICLLCCCCVGCMERGILRFSHRLT